MKTLVSIVLTLTIAYSPAWGLTWAPSGDVVPAKVLEYEEINSFPFSSFRLVVEIPCGVREVGKLMSLSRTGNLVLGYLYEEPKAGELVCLALPREKEVVFTYPALGDSWYDVLVLGENL